MTRVNLYRSQRAHVYMTVRHRRPHGFPRGRGRRALRILHREIHVPTGQPIRKVIREDGTTHPNFLGTWQQ